MHWYLLQFYFFPFVICLFATIYCGHVGCVKNTVKLNEPSDFVSSENKIYKTAKLGNVAKVKKLLTDKFELYQRNPSGATFLHIAAEMGNVKAVKALVKAGTPLEVKDLEGETPLYKAVKRGHLEAVRVLLEMGADGGRRTSSGMSCLQAAARTGRLEVLEELKRSGVYVNSRDYKGENAIYHAALSNNSQPVITFLKAIRVDINAKKRGETQLHLAARIGDELVVQNLIASGATVNAMNSENHSPAYLAISNSHLEIAKILIGTNNDTKQDLLHCAAREGNNVALKSLIAIGISMNTKDANGKTALMNAALCKQLTTMKFLVKQGVHLSPNGEIKRNVTTVENLMQSGINLEDENGKTVLYRTAEVENAQKMKILLTIKRNVTQELNLAMNRNDSKVFHFILSSIDADIQNYDIKSLIYGALHQRNIMFAKMILDKRKEAWTVLLELVTNGNITDYSFLISAGVDLNSIEYERKPLLFKAAQGGNVGLVKFLIQNNINVTNSLFLAIEDEDEAVIDGLTKAGIEIITNKFEKLLYQAVQKGKIKILKALIKKGYKPATLLHLAAEENDIAVGSVLLSNGVDIELKDDNGKTALFRATQRGNGAFKKLLIENGADVENTIHLIAKECDALINEYMNAPTDGKPPLYRAGQKGQLDLMSLMIKKGASMKGLLHLAAEEGDKTAVSSFVKVGADVNEKDSEERTPIYRAAMAGNIDIMRILIDKGVNIETQNRDRERVIHEVVKMKNRTAVEAVLAVGADINAKTGGWWGGKTPLYLAVWHNAPDIISLLIQRRAEVNAKNNFEETALHLAANQGYLEAVRLLIEAGATISEPGVGGLTPLTLASSRGHTEVAQLLRSRGAV